MGIYILPDALNADLPIFDDTLFFQSDGSSASGKYYYGVYLQIFTTPGDVFNAEVLVPALEWMSLHPDKGLFPGFRWLT